MQGEIPNRKGQAVVHSWFGVRFASGAFQGIEELPELLKRTRFGQRSFPNPSGAPDLIPAQTLLPEAVRYARLWMSEQRAQINAQLAPDLATTEASSKRFGRPNTASSPAISMKKTWPASGCGRNR
jgi:hypothetical protein